MPRSITTTIDWIIGVAQQLNNAQAKQVSQGADVPIRPDQYYILTCNSYFVLVGSRINSSIPGSSS